MLNNIIIYSISCPYTGMVKFGHINGKIIKSVGGFKFSYEIKH